MTWPRSPSSKVMVFHCTAHTLTVISLREGIAFIKRWFTFTPATQVLCCVTTSTKTNQKKKMSTEWLSYTIVQKRVKTNSAKANVTTRKSKGVFSVKGFSPPFFFLFCYGMCLCPLLSSSSVRSTTSGGDTQLDWGETHVHLCGGGCVVIVVVLAVADRSAEWSSFHDDKLLITPPQGWAHL